MKWSNSRIHVYLRPTEGDIAVATKAAGQRELAFPKLREKKKNEEQKEYKKKNTKFCFKQIFLAWTCRVNVQFFAIVVEKTSGTYFMTDSNVLHFSY